MRFKIGDEVIVTDTFMVSVADEMNIHFSKILSVPKGSVGVFKTVTLAKFNTVDCDVPVDKTKLRKLSKLDKVMK